MLAAQPRLPWGYRIVEYLGVTGTQYIDSEIECTSDLIVEIKYSYSTKINAALCGGIAPLGGNSYFCHHASPYTTTSGSIGNHYWLQANSYNTAAITSTEEIGTIYTLYADPVTGYATLNGNPRTFTPLASNFTTGKSYGIGARISNTGTIQSRPNRIYYAKFWRNGVHLGDFIPCVRKADNVAGMYDLVTQTFFTNAGTGEFIVGPDVN